MEISVVFEKEKKKKVVYVEEKEKRGGAEEEEEAAAHVLIFPYIPGTERKKNAAEKKFSRAEKGGQGRGRKKERE